MQHPADDAAFDAIMAAAGDKPVLCKFSAEWCGPCQMIKGNMEELANAHAEKMVFIHVDVDHLPGTSEKWEVRCMPTVKLIVNGAQKGNTVEGANMSLITALVESAFA